MGKLSKSPATHAERLRASQNVLETILRSHGTLQTLRLLQYAIEERGRELAGPGPEIDAQAVERHIKANELLDAAYYAIRKEL